ncbi:hypothetical protein B296_00005682, partial [Ensete ventricosum]
FCHFVDAITSFTSSLAVSQNGNPNLNIAAFPKVYRPISSPIFTSSKYIVEGSAVNGFLTKIRRQRVPYRRYCMMNGGSFYGIYHWKEESNGGSSLVVCYLNNKYGDNCILLSFLSFIRVWKNIIQKGDTVIDATCGNGYDTLALLTMVADESGRGCVYGMDIQQEALENTAALLEISVKENKRKLVKLLKLCHSKMEDIVQNDNSVSNLPVLHPFIVHKKFCLFQFRLVVFNLGYLPGGDKAILTTPGTTLAALQAAGRVLGSGGLISVMVYVGHPGGRDELESIQGFASALPVEFWASFKLEMLNRPTGPVLVLIFKK